MFPVVVASSTDDNISINQVLSGEVGDFSDIHKWIVSRPIESSVIKSCGYIELPDGNYACDCDVEPSWFMHPSKEKAVVLDARAGWIINFARMSATRLVAGNDDFPYWWNFHLNDGSGMGYRDYPERLCFTNDGFFLESQISAESCKFDMNGKPTTECIEDAIEYEEMPFRDSSDFYEKTRLAPWVYSFFKPYLRIWQKPDNCYMEDESLSPFIQTQTGIYQASDKKQPIFELPGGIREQNPGEKIYKFENAFSFYEQSYKFSDMEYAFLTTHNDKPSLHFYFWRAQAVDNHKRRLSDPVSDETQNYSFFAFISESGQILSHGSFLTHAWNPGLPVHKSKPQRVGNESIALMVHNSNMDKCGHYVYVIVSPESAEDKPVWAICSDAPLYFSAIPLKDGSLVALAPKIWLGKDAPVNRASWQEHDIYGPARIYIIPKPHAATKRP